MSLTSKWAEKRQRPKFGDRLGLAQPLLAAGALTFFSLLMGLPLLFLLNSAFTPDLAPAGLMSQFQLGSLYTEVASWLQGPLNGLISSDGGLSFGGVLMATLGTSLFAWAIAMMLVGQWRAQLPVMEELVPIRFAFAIVVTIVLIAVLFWAARLGGAGLSNTGALALGVLYFAFSTLILMAWYYALTGTFVSWSSIVISSFVIALATTVFVWVLGYLIPQPLVGVSGFTKIGFVLAHLFGLWLLIVLGVHFLARQTLEQSDWQDMDELTRGQQVDFALAIMKTLGHADNSNRWLPGQAIAQRLGAKHSMTVQALRRLNEFDLVRASQASNRPDHWRLSTESLHAVNLQDLMEAFGATLDPSNGVYEEGPQPAMMNLADQEKRVFRTDLASLTRGDRGPALTSDAPAFISLISDRGVGTQTDAAGAPPPVGESSKAYERLTALLEKEAGTSHTPASQLTSDADSAFPAFGQPPQTNMARTRAIAEDSQEAESVIEADDAEIKLEEDAKGAETIVEKATDSVTSTLGAIASGTAVAGAATATGLTSLLNKDATDKDADTKDEVAKDEAAKPMVSTGLTSLVSDLPENLGSYTLAFVSQPQSST